MTKWRPVELVESRTEYTEGDTESGRTNTWDREEDIPSFLPRHSIESEWPQNIVPRPSIEPDWPRQFGHRGESSNSPVVPPLPQRPGGHPGGLFGAFEDLVKETEDMAHSFLQVGD